VIKYFQTTTLILTICLLVSVGWTLFCFFMAARRHKTCKTKSARPFVIVPALVLGPLALVAAFRGFGINLLFPVHLLSDLSHVMIAAIVPALVLCLASGLLVAISRAVRFEYEFWNTKSFTTMMRATGLSPDRYLVRLVSLKSLAHSWSQCLPWLFGELIVVESVFNAPGLGLDAWHLARMRDFEGLLFSVAGLFVLYGICVVLSASVTRWIGRRLESYV